MLKKHSYWLVTCDYVSTVQIYIVSEIWMCPIHPPSFSSGDHNSGQSNYIDIIVRRHLENWEAKKYVSLTTATSVCNLHAICLLPPATCHLPLVILTLVILTLVILVWKLPNKQQCTMRPPLLSWGNDVAFHEISFLRIFSGVFLNYKTNGIWREKFYPGPGFEPGPLAFRANSLTNWAIQDMYRTTIELISWATFSVIRTDLLCHYYVL